MKNKPIQTLFEGLNKQQTKEFIRRIIPALEDVRREVLEGTSNQVQADGVRACERVWKGGKAVAITHPVPIHE